jgi:hypothetical protein
MAEAVDIRCRGCRRRLGIGPADFRIYCDAWCAADYPATAEEDRNALIEAIYQDLGLSKAQLSRDFALSRQRVDQILAQRSITPLGLID